MKYVVIGGVAAGASFATRMRRLDENAKITILEQGADVSFASCALPYYLGGIIPDRNTLIERTPEQLKQKNNLDVRVFSQVSTIDPTKKHVHVTNLRTNEAYTESYDKLILATGASPIKPTIAGLESAQNAFTIRSVTDADKIKTFMETNNPQHVTILGAGMASLELAENFKHRGMQVTIIERSAHVAHPYDEEISSLILDQLLSQNIEVILHHSIASIANGGATLTLDDGQELQTDLLLIATGVRPNSKIAQEAGIRLAADNHIIVDNQFQTNLPDIYAIGDVIETTSFITGRSIPSVLSSPANRQGHLLADIFANPKRHYPGFIGVGVAKIFDLTASYVGYTENMLKIAGITDYDNVFITPFSHAYFYPHADRLNLKLIFAKETGKILGAQAVGTDGVDKRIAQISVAISGGLTVNDLPQLEIPYSPPYSSSRDVVNIAGYVASNKLSDSMKTIKESAITAELLRSGFFLDIREPGRPKSGHIEATVNIPFSQLREKIAEIPQDKKVYLTFRKGLNNYQAARILHGKGYDVTLIEE